MPMPMALSTCRYCDVVELRMSDLVDILEADVTRKFALQAAHDLQSATGRSRVAAGRWASLRRAVADGFGGRLAGASVTHV